MTEQIQIDIRRVIANKNPALARWLPGVVIHMIERLVHVRELNRVLRFLKDEEGVSFARGALASLGARVETVGAERLITVDRPLVVANHPLGGLDGLALISAVGEHYKLVVLPVNDLLMNIPQLTPVFVPINKHGSNRAYRRDFDRAFQRADAVVHFPAGLCSRRKGSRVRDLQWQKSFVTRARKTGRTIVPTYVDGANSAFFYNLARLRRLSGLRFNLEMIWLVDEMFKQRGKTIRIVFGPPVGADAIPPGGDSWALANRLRMHVYRLAENPDAVFVPEADPV